MPLLPEQTMFEAASAVLTEQLDRLHKQARQVKEDQDVEAIHRMRVTTRRIRAALRIYEPFFKRSSIQPWARALRRLAGTLGEVRDLDVQIGKAQAFAETMLAPERPDLDQLIAELSAHRTEAYEDLLRMLRKRGYTRIIEGLTKLAKNPDKQARKLDLEVPARVCDLLPVILWEHYGQVRSFAPSIVQNRPDLETLHRLRITLKRFRYVVEFHAELLGQGGNQLIGLSTEAQDTLGALHDADVTGQLLADYIEAHAAETSQATSLTSVQQYANYQASQLSEGISSFPALWSRLDSPEMRRLLSEAILQL